MGVFDPATLIRAARSVVAESAAIGRQDAQPPDQEVLNASQVLLDLRLPATLEAALAPPLQTIGFELHDSKGRDRYGPSVRHFTVAERGSVCRILIHVPRAILEKWAQAHNDALVTVPYAFPANAVVYVFSQDCQVIEFTFKQLIEIRWKYEGVTAEFIPWQYVTTLQGSAPEDARNMISKLLRLQNGTEMPAPGAPISPALPGTGAAGALPTTIHLRPDDLRAIVRILRERPDFQDEVGRRVLIKLADLKDVCASVTYTGNSQTVAGEIVLQLDGYGLVKDPPNTHALGLLLSYLWDLPDLPVNDGKILRKISRDYNLLPT